MASVRFPAGWLLPLVLLLSSGWAADDICSQVKVPQLMSSSASGRWYLVASKKQDVMNKTKMHLRMPKCGGINNALPCSCTVLDITSNLPEPVSEYNVTIMSYNMSSGKYDITPFQMWLAENTSNTAVFNAVPQEGKMAVIRYLASDDHQTYMLWLICSDTGEGLDLWFLSKTPNATDVSVQEVNKALGNNNLTMSMLVPVTQTDCIYPPEPNVKTRQADKFRVF